MENISFDKKKLRAFKREYNQAKKDELERFYFENKLFLVSYAKYLIEYLDTKIK